MFFLCGGALAACPDSPGTVTGTVTAANLLGQTVKALRPASSRRPSRRCATGPLMRMFILSRIRPAKFEDRSTKSNSNAILQYNLSLASDRTLASSPLTLMVL